MSDGMSTTKKAIIGGVVAGAVLGGAYMLMSSSSSKKKQEEEDTAFGTDSAAHKAPAAAPAQDDDEPVIATTSTPAGSAPTSEAPKTAPAAKVSAPAPAPTTQVSAPAEPEAEMPTQVQEGATHFERLGVVMKLPDGWDCKQEVSPVPTASMITIAKPEFAMMPPPSNPTEFGRVPIILLSVEDIALEGLNAKEYSQKKKMIGMQQLMMMTQGMFQPRLVHEGKPSNAGPFDFQLEYDQPQPPMQICVMDLFTVKHGFAYCLQIMAKPEVVQQYKPEIMKIAQGIDLYPHPLASTFTDTACLRVRTGKMESCAPPSYKIMQTRGMLVFNTMSQQKTDSIKVCKSTDEPVLDFLAMGNTVSETQLPGDFNMTVVKQGQKECKLLQKGEFAVIAEPLKANTVTVIDAFLQEILENTSACTEEAKTWYESNARGFRFEVPNTKAMIMESRVGDGAILYSPDGLDAQGPGGAEPGAPAMTIRVEDPSTDSDCMPNLDAWYTRITEESAQDPTMQDLKRGLIAGRDSVSFFSKDMVEVGPGQREERVAKIVIFCNDENRTHMLRWEASTGNYRRSERQFDALLESYTLI